MVKTEIQKKGGVVLTTKEGIALIKYTFEVGDEFIPQINSLISKSHKANVKGEIKSIVENKLICKVKGFNNQKEIFISLTPSQANTIKNKIRDGVALNQRLFCAYEYKDKDDISRIGVGFKVDRVPPKEFEDFEEFVEENQEKLIEEAKEEENL